MADRKITDLTALAAGSQATGDLLTIVDVSEGAAADKNKKITVESLFKGIPGDVGIGTSAPGRQLQINGDSDTQIRVVAAAGGAAGIQFGDANDSVMGGVNFDASDDSLQLRGFNNSERMRIDSSGRLLIGGTASTHSDAQARLQVHSAGATNIVIARNDSTISAGNTIGMLQFYGNDGGTYQQCAYIRCDADLDHANNDKPSRLVFGTTADGASSATERMRIDSSGRVLIGATSGTELLEVHGDTPVLKLRDTSSYASETGPAIGFQGNDSNGAIKQFSTIRGISQSANNGQLAFDTRTGGSLVERMRIDSSGNVGIKNTVASAIGAVTNAADLVIGDGSNAAGITIYTGTGNGGELAFADGTSGSATQRGRIFYAHGDNSMRISTNAGEAMRIDSAGNVGIGASSVSNKLSIVEGAYEEAIVRLNGPNQTSEYLSFGVESGLSTIQAGGAGSFSNALAFKTASSGTESERMRITTDGDLLIGQNSTDTPGFGNTTLGAAFENLGADGVAIFASRSNNICAGFNRAQDGAIVQFASAGTVEGSISISGSTTSYNGAHLARWTQLAGGAERTEILRGSVLSNLDEMCEWGEEDNEQLNRMKVSDVEGDVNVSGVFQAWDDDDDTYTNDFYCAMTGDFVIRIAQGTTVARGDLLMSAGDGTAKPQDDDIVRSKTIAKVTSTTVSTTYADGSYCVPCVLMAC